MASSARIWLSPSKAGARRGVARVDRGRGETAAVSAEHEGPSAVTAVATRTELRVYLPIGGLQRQFAAYLGVPTRARGYPPAEGDHALIVEVAPGLAIERVTDLALRAEPAVGPGILFVERHFGVLEVHARDAADVGRAGQAILEGSGHGAAHQLRPRTLYAGGI